MQESTGVGGYVRRRRIVGGNQLLGLTRGVAGYYTWPIRRIVHAVRTFRRSRIELQFVASGGAQVTLRPPRMEDGPEWRRIRLRDRAIIERYWTTLPDDWERWHSTATWARHCLGAGALARSGEAYQWVIEVDGMLTGECELWLDAGNRRGEIGAWVGTHAAGTGVAGAAVRAMLDFGFGELRLARIVAPVEPENARALHLDRVGFRCEGTMSSYMEAGGQRRDYQLWALTADRWEPGSPLPT